MTDKQLWSAAKVAYIGARGGDWPLWEDLTDAERLAWRRMQGEGGTGLVAPGQPCHAPGVWYFSTHLASTPDSCTRAVAYCPACLGLGTKP